jgi:hypothetical protein
MRIGDAAKIFVVEMARREIERDLHARTAAERGGKLVAHRDHQRAGHVEDQPR